MEVRTRAGGYLVGWVTEDAPESAAGWASLRPTGWPVTGSGDGFVAGYPKLLEFPIVRSKRPGVNPTPPDHLLVDSLADIIGVTGFQPFFDGRVVSLSHSVRSGFMPAPVSHGFNYFGSP
jgi:hypothetical protein